MDNVSKIKDRLSIVDVISGYLKLQKAGASLKAPCPFHNEKTPSFFVSPERQTWHCFGCQKGGDIFTFVKEIEGVEFPEALKILAARAGIELETFDSTLKDSKDRLYEVCETSTRFFEKQLGNSAVGKRALEYLRERGLEDRMIAQFRLGFAPNTWDALSKYLRNSGYTDKEIIDAGLVVKRELSAINLQLSAGIYDRFRSRIVFPIADVNGRVVGFTGRIFEFENPHESMRTERTDMQIDAEKVGESQHEISDNQRPVPAKYINTPQTLIYDKSKILYGLNYSRGDIRKNDRCLLVEGNMDMLMSYQTGVKNVVASSGTAMTPMHLAVLKRYTTNLDFCFDTDQAGLVATKRGIGMALSQNFNVKVVAINDHECKDPADYIKKYGKKWEEIAAFSKPAIEFYFDKAKESYDPESVESKKNLILTVAPFIKRLSSRVEKSHWINQISFLLRTKEDAVENDIRSVPDDLSVYENVSGFAKNSSQREPNKIKETETPDILNETLVSLAIKKPALFKDEIPRIDQQLLNPFTSQIFTELSKTNLDEFNFNSFIKNFDSDMSLNLNLAYFKAESWWENFNDEELKSEFSNILNKLKQKIIHLRLANLEYDIKTAEAAKDRDKISILAEQFNKLTQELSAIHKI